jgi:uncharacterized protein (DUF1800 family)
MVTWNETTARHLLSRCLFGFTRDDLAAALSLSLDTFVDTVLLDAGYPDTVPGTWVSEDPLPNNNAIDRQREGEMIYWWLDLMLKQGQSLREKMVLFWHNHFVSEISKVNYPQRMYWQNKLFRDFAFGDLKALTKAITIDPAMLIYLDGVQNSKTSPNENYGRELLELFTLGIGHYTETDVQEAARALTGWQVNKLASTFNASRFDNTPKTFLNKTANFTHSTLIDHIFTQPQTAVFICTKLYKEFIHYQPDQAFVDQMAAVFRQANFLVKPVLAFLFKSDHFYETRFISSRIKSPVELVIGSAKFFNITNPDYRYLHETARQLQQSLFEPPDVRGWEGQRKWISSVTYPVRNTFTDSIINGKKLNGQSLNFKIDPLSYARSYASAEDATRFVSDVSSYVIQFPLSKARKDFLLETLLSGTIVSNWSTFTPMADTRIANFIKALLRLPEYQLC